MRKFIIIFLIIFVLAAYFFFKDSRPLYEKKREPLTVSVGWIGSLTGPINTLFIDNLNAVKLALKEYQAHRNPEDPHIILFIDDDHYRNEILLHKFNQMMAATPKPVAIMIGTYAGVKQIAPLALKDNVLIVSSIDNDRQIASLNQHVFLIAKETEALAGLVVNAIIDQGKKNIAVIYYGGNQDFMGILANISKEILISNGSTAELLKYEKGTTDFRSLLEKTKANQVDGYVFLGYQEIGFAMKQAREMGITAPFYSVNVITDPILQKNAEGAANGTYFAHFTRLDGNRVETDEFLYKYEKTYKKKPLLEWTAMQGYDAARILFTAIKNASNEPGELTENLRYRLLETANFEGVSGNITILPSGASRGIYTRLYVLQNGEAVPVE